MMISLQWHLLWGEVYYAEGEQSVAKDEFLNAEKISIYSLSLAYLRPGQGGRSPGNDAQTFRSLVAGPLPTITAQTTIAPTLYAPSCGWWGYWKTDPCGSFRLC